MGHGQTPGGLGDASSTHRPGWTGSPTLRTLLPRLSTTMALLLGGQSLQETASTGPPWTKKDLLHCLSLVQCSPPRSHRLIKTAFHHTLRITNSASPYAPAIPLQSLLLLPHSSITHQPLHSWPNYGIEALGDLFTVSTLLYLDDMILQLLATS